MEIAQDWYQALLGGVIIGVAVSLMLLLNGRVTGISGIINGTLSPVKGDTAWRYFFIAGLILGGSVLQALNPSTMPSVFVSDIATTIAAGLLVGFGTVMGSGCTSGHGVCGISRLSPRSLAATLTFIGFGVAAVALFKRLGVLA